MGGRVGEYIYRARATRLLMASSAHGLFPAGYTSRALPNVGCSGRARFRGPGHGPPRISNDLVARCLSAPRLRHLPVLGR